VDSIEQLLHRFPEEIALIKEILKSNNITL